MNCSDFERIWNERIDGSSSRAGGAGCQISPATERALAEHTASGPTCRAKASGYVARGGSILGWAPPRGPPADLANRVLEAARAQPASAQRAWNAPRSSGPLIRFVAVAAAIM